VSRLWDDSLYAGAADFYLAGRLPYPARLADVLRERLALDGSGRLLDLGCGPGSLTLVLARLFQEVVAVDADPDMVRVGAAEADRQGIDNVTWLHAYAEDLDDVGGQFRVVTLAQSFHWMDRPVVAAKIGRWLEPNGSCVHVGATTHEGTGDAVGPHPAPPRDRVTSLVQGYLGPHRRAGQQVVVGEHTPDDEESVFRAAGFSGPEVVAVPGGEVLDRSDDQIVASVLSLSSAAPHLFDDRLPTFVSDLRKLLREVSPSGLFSEQLQDIRLSVWRM
jgi:SAM-dependent methyltransferase